LIIKNTSMINSAMPKSWWLDNPVCNN